MFDKTTLCVLCIVLSKPWYSTYTYPKHTLQTHTYNTCIWWHILKFTHITHTYAHVHSITYTHTMTSYIYTHNTFCGGTHRYIANTHNTKTCNTWHYTAFVHTHYTVLHFYTLHIWLPGNALLDMFLVDGVLDSRSLVDVSGEPPQVRVVHDPLLIALGMGKKKTFDFYLQIKTIEIDNCYKTFMIMY